MARYIFTPDSGVSSPHHRGPLRVPAGEHCVTADAAAPAVHSGCGGPAGERLWTGFGEGTGYTSPRELGDTTASAIGEKQ